ncbi:MAG: HD domain-containing protein [Candidatus Eremiobacteraeota bacterium]|nr:HD domain-containing protein [Candidatus Eremiobacteraeota bacterium]
MDFLNKKIDDLIRCVNARWELGLSKEINLKANGRKIVCTSVYGNIEIPSEIVPFLDSFYLQRLRNISQTGFLRYVFPEARHSRFEHSLGVYWVLETILKNNKDKISDSEETKLRLSALLHDIGHGAFSHLTEIILGWYIFDEKYMNSCLPKKNKPSYHERRAACLILGENEISNSILKDAIIELCGEDGPEFIAKCIQGNTEEWLSPLINGPLDADRFDYIKRDAFFAGTTGGGIEVDYLTRNILISKKEEKIFLPEKVHAVYLQMVYGREFVYGETIFHPVHCCVQSMFMVALNEALKFINELGIDVVKILNNMDKMEDRDLLYLLDLISNCKDKRSPIFNDLYGRILRRELYGRFTEYTYYDYRNYLEEFVKKYLKTHAKSKEIARKYNHIRIKEAFSPLQYLGKKELDEILPRALSNQLNEKDVLILCFQPDISSIDKEKCEKPFTAIQLKEKGGNKFIKYKDYIKERIGKPKLSSSLFTLQKILFKGILFGPKRLLDNPLWDKNIKDSKLKKKLFYYFMRADKTQWFTKDMK